LNLLLTAVIPAHNPHLGRLRRTLAGLRAQTLAPERWETVLIDNASAAFPAPAEYADVQPGNLRMVREPLLGLSSARLRGFAEARGEFCVLVDDDNVLAPDYLERIVALFEAHPEVGALGGRVLPEFEKQPESWQSEFLPLLALRDTGGHAHISRGLRPANGSSNEYPVEAAPVGAGMALRRAAWAAWSASAPSKELPDRRGSDLSSSGDNDIVLTLLENKWEVATFSELRVIHLIPASRLECDYLARLNRGIQKSWMRVLTKHNVNPWPPIAAWTVPLRKAKAWLTYRAWSSPAAAIRWQGACGHFEGRAT